MQRRPLQVGAGMGGWCGGGGGTTAAAGEGGGV